MAAKDAFHRSENADSYRTNASFVFNDENTREVLLLLDPQPGDVILDVGCGSGELTLKIHQIVAANGASGRVVGIDAGEDMIRAAKALQADDTDSLEFHVCDAHDLEHWLKQSQLHGSFNKVFSNAALHWVKRDPALAIRGMRAALKPDKTSKLALEMGGFCNCIGVRSGIHAALRQRGIDPEPLDPWFFPTAEAYRELLVQHGAFNVDTAYLHPRPTIMPRATGFRGWLKSFGGPFFNAVPASEQAKLLDELEQRSRIDMYDAHQDQWTLMYVRLRVRATI